jgi:hypothetical protein
MVREIGTVVAVINEDMILVRSSEPLEEDRNILIFVRATVGIRGNASDTPSPREIVVPKGRMDVLMDEGDGLYLARRYRETVERIQSLATQLPFLRTEKVPGDWSALLDSPSIQRTVHREVRVGDLVGLEEP